MHKNKPPGLFDFAERSIRYLVGFWFIAGLVLSLLVHTGMVIRRADAKGPGLQRNPDLLKPRRRLETCHRHDAVTDVRA